MPSRLINYLSDDLIKSEKAIFFSNYLTGFFLMQSMHKSQQSPNYHCAVINANATHVDIFLPNLTSR